MRKQHTPATVRRTALLPERLSRFSLSSQMDFSAMSKRIRREPLSCLVAEPTHAIRESGRSCSTTFTQSLGDEAAIALLGVHDTIVRNALSALGGREVKHTGDGIMASFVSTAGAVRCAIQIQRELAKHEKANPERPLKVRVGAAAGEPVEQHNDLFGCTVQLAARLCAHAQPEQILVSNAIAELC